MRLLTLVLAALFAGASPVAVAGPPAIYTGPHSVFTDPPLARSVAADAYTLARRRSQTLGVPLIVQISADWCQPCQRLKKTLAPWKTRDDLVYVVVDVEDRRFRPVMRWAGSNTIPQLHVYDAAGKHVGHSIGYGGQTAAALERSLVPAANEQPVSTPARTYPGNVFGYSVRTSKPFVGCSPNTQGWWRRHVQDDHGRPLPSFSDERSEAEWLGEAHALAHFDEARSRQAAASRRSPRRRLLRLGGG